MKIAHFADIHYRLKDLDEIHNCFSSAIDNAIQEKCDCAVIAGDLWDSSTLLEHDTVMKAVSNIEKLANAMPVLMIYGTKSHDRPGSLDIFPALATAFDIYVAKQIEQIVLTADGELTLFDDHPAGEKIAILFSCLPSVTKAYLLSRRYLDIAESQAEVKELLFDVFRGFGQNNTAVDCPTILVAHGTVTGSETSSGQIMVGKDIEFGLDDLKQAQADIVMLGHIHKRQSRDNVFYSGSISRLDFGEEEAKGFLIHDITDQTHRFIETPSRRRITIEIDPQNPQVPEGLDGALVKVRYRVNEEDAHIIEEGEIEGLLPKTCGVVVEKTIIPTQRIRAEGISKIKSLSEKIVMWGKAVGKEIPEGVLDKVVMVEEMSADQIAERY